MYHINLYKGYNDKCFIGLTPEEVIKNMPDFEGTYYIGIDKDVRKDICRDFSAGYDENGLCNAIEFCNGNAKVFLNGEQLIGLTEPELMEKLRKIFPSEDCITDKESFMFINSAFAVSMIDGKSESILVGKPGYFDFLLDELKSPVPASHWIIPAPLSADCSEPTSVPCSLTEDICSVSDHTVTEAVYISDSAAISLKLPKNWDYSLYEYSRDFSGCGISFYSRDYPNNTDIHLFYYKDGFETSGTVLSEQDITFDSGLSGRIGTYGSYSHWDYLVFTNVSGSYAVTVETDDMWWEEYRDQLMEILNTVKLGDDVLPSDTEA